MSLSGQAEAFGKPYEQDVKALAMDKVQLCAACMPKVVNLQTLAGTPFSWDASWGDWRANFGLPFTLEGAAAGKRFHSQIHFEVAS